jgi:hypothetical protein
MIVLVPIACCSCFACFQIADIACLDQLSGDLNIGRAFPTFAADIFRHAPDMAPRSIVPS